MDTLDLKPVSKDCKRSRLWAGSNGVIYRLDRRGNFRAFRTLVRSDRSVICDRVRKRRDGRPSYEIVYRDVAQLVLRAFKPKWTGGTYDLYKDGNPANTVPGNLYRGTYEEREADRHFHAEYGVGNIRREVLER